MRSTILSAGFIGLTSLTALGCKSEAPTASSPIALLRFAGSDWSAPVNMGEPINSTASDQNAILTKDGLTLYFSSDRLVEGENKGLDIWVSKRPTADAPWGTPENLQAINTSAAELAPNLSVDGHLLFFTSNRVGSTPVSPGSTTRSVDIWMSRREDTEDDFHWGVPVKLGDQVNTANTDQAPMYLQSAEEGSGNLYFNRGLLTAGAGDIYYAAITREGETLGDAVPLSQLNDPDANDAAVSIRADGREIFFWSSRPDGATPTLTPQNLWSSTRQSVYHPWSAPTKLDAPLSSAANDLTPSLSFDGRTLIFSSNRLPSMGGNDLWISTRAEGGR